MQDGNFGVGFHRLDLLKDISLCLSQTLPRRAAAKHPLAAVTFNLLNGGKVHRRIAVPMAIDQSEVVACFF